MTPTLTWTTPNPEAPGYWESTTGGWWITTHIRHRLRDGTSATHYILCNGGKTLGAYDSLLEAQQNAEPQWCDDELLEDLECFWCLGRHPDGTVCRFAPYYIKQEDNANE